MKDECLICKAPLVYLNTDELMECAICHTTEIIKNNNNKLARDAFQNAGNLLSGEDYGEMLIRLNKMAPGFIRENQS